MERTRWDRWAPASGVVYLVLLLVTISMVPDSPALEEPIEVQHAFVRDNQAVLTAQILIYTVAQGFFLWFTAAVTARVRLAGQPQLAAAALAAGSVYAGMSLVLTGLSQGVLYHLETVEPDVLLGIDVVGGALINTSYLALGVFILAAGLALVRTRLAAWFGYASVPAAVAIALAATTWAGDGFWSPEGGYLFLSLIVFAGWIVTAAVLLIRRRPAPVPAG